MEKNKHFLVGIFGDQDDLLHGVEDIRKKGVKIYEVFTPFPVHGLEHALGYQRSWTPKAAFMFGFLGTCLAIIMQVGMMVIDWPMVIGGKPYLAIPDFVPVTFELTVLLASYGMTLTFLFVKGYLPHKVPRIFDIRATDDKHVMAIDLANNSLSEEQIRSILKDVHAEEVYRRDFTDEENQSSFIKYVVDLFTNGVTRSSRIAHHR
ncbi:MAG: DUF3341 domain-containing protein [Thermoflexibacter sp.]|jgi:hypothetical protein|uniref:Quinol:cytochrome c oxidoreductase membrane protein n=1 Tax=Thermoflexibacter ruber TaxID=1003 RepID=A0A1I2HJ65_9BACT|nr:DUF3341 domain-containing protein [Thermoflexibacter ruber]SFF30345.1 Protein of unknown function [Thermoflexibacter ruber]